jgi:hypothetical protein
MVPLRMIHLTAPKREEFACTRELRADSLDKYERGGIGIPDEWYTCVIKAK